ncbi:MAG: ribonuclease III [Bacteroidota bacterium]|nr:ribonuclease III [Bacteroidota bacterium]
MMGIFSRKFSKLWRQYFVKKQTTRKFPIVSELPESYKNIDLKKFEQVAEYSIKNPALFYQAFTHRSYLQYADKPGIISNERLEFLGDSILNLVVAEYLYEKFPDADEGELTKLRSRLVNRKALAIFARELNLWSYLLLSSSASQAVGQGSDTILADGFEAVVGAMYLDQGIEPIRNFIIKRLLSAIRIKAISIDDTNYKSLLLEYAQARGLPAPRYSISNSEGPDHDRIFTVEVYINNEVCGKGTGKNKKSAEQEAAAEAVVKFNISNNNA